MIPDISAEVSFRTSRSGGPGGQNVNKVETAVTATWNPGSSRLFSEAEKELLQHKLAHRVDKEGIIAIRSTTHRTQLANKEEVLKRMQALVDKALEKKKLRIATRPSAKQTEKRLENKKRQARKKAGRQDRSWKTE